uniref:Endonuclease-reverse transcriptase n=1 Tax=Cacopsylla melanoneura TaxID=428564 RepID=A0A8D8XLX2_9HEMI
MRMLRWMCGLTRKDRVRNEKIRETVKVGPLGKKIQESRMRWFGHVERRDESYIGKQVEKLVIEGKRKRGRPKMRWRDKKDLREERHRLELCGDAELKKIMSTPSRIWKRCSERRVFFTVNK